MKQKSVVVSRVLVKKQAIKWKMEGAREYKYIYKTTKGMDILTIDMYSTCIQSQSSPSLQHKLELIDCQILAEQTA